MASEYLLAIDQGTTGTTVLIVNPRSSEGMKILGRSTVNFTQYYPDNGWVEHDLDEIWQTVGLACKHALAQAHEHDAEFRPHHIAAIGITNQRETLCIFDPASGVPATKAIVWQCKRSLDICQRMRNDGYEATIRNKTGLVLDPYFSGTKLTWILENDKDIARKLQRREVVCGTIDSYLLCRLTGGATFATEPSNASRTLLFDIGTCTFDKDLLAAFGVSRSDILPEVKESSGVFGTTKGTGFLPDGIPIAGILGDQQAALAGQGCYETGDAKCTYGTGAFMLLNIGEKPLRSTSGLLTTVAWSCQNKVTYAFEGSAFIAGAAIQFIRDQFALVKEACYTEELARAEVAAPSLYFVPALSGLGAPHWVPEARGAWLGLTRGTTRGQIVRATLEGIAFQVYELLGAMTQDARHPIPFLKVDGGAAANDVLMQIQADLADIPVDRPINLETTAMGAALFAGLGVGLFKGFEDLRNVRRSDKLFHPDRSDVAKLQRKQQIDGWHRAVRAVKCFAES
jgi:glycerol kinase